MFMVLFDVCPHATQMQQYLEFAGILRPELQQIEGFLENERFSDNLHPERLLSISTWVNEKALIRWRTHAQHHHFQGQARAFVFADYRLRIGEITADSAAPGYTMPQQRFDETERGAAKAILVLELEPNGDPADEPLLRAAQIDPANPPAGLADYTRYTSIYRSGKQVIQLGWQTMAAAEAWHAAQIVPLAHAGLRSRFVRVIRAYGIRERGEAPQYYPQVAAETAIW